MYASRSPWLTVVLFGALFAGCVEGGGRGSSGFDITENIIISQVLETQECRSTGDLTFCPADQRPPLTPTATATATAATPTAPASPTPTPTVNPTPHVDTGLADGTAIACTRPGAGAPCRLLFSFGGFGFPDAATFRVASRLRTPDSAWVLADPPSLNTAVDPPTLDTVVSIPVPADASAPHAQFAVLVFLTPPAAVPARFEALAESGADFAFVTPEFVLEIVTTGPPPTSTLTSTPVSTTPSPTPSAPTPTATVTPLLSGPVITYFGVARADSVSLAPSDVDPAGRPVYVRPFGQGLSLIVEGRPGTSGRPVGGSAYDPAGAQPDLQMILSRPLGNGSEVVCDRLPPNLGGVPATIPFAFSDAQPVLNAINDLGCRVDDGQGNPVARTAAAACTTDRSGEFSFVDSTTTAQFCLPIAGAWAFAAGDTIVAARLRDVSGDLGSQREIVVRNANSAEHSPTPTTPAGSPPPTAFTPTPAIPTPSPSTPTAAPPTGSQPPTSFTPTPPVSPTPTPTSTPVSDDGPVITHLGLASADDRPLAPLGDDAAGRPIYTSSFGYGIILLAEARPGFAGQRLGSSAYNPDGQPDLQLIVSRPLGNGSAIVCDARPPLIGGVPATDPLVFATDAGDAMNDLGCRVDDGAGQPVARTASQQACTRSDAAGSLGFAFVSEASTVQYCLPIASAWAFSTGETVVAARARDIDGRTGAAREIVVRVGNP